MPHRENLEKLGGRMLEERSPEMPLAERMLLITQKMAERSQQEAALLQLLNQPGKKSEKVYTDAWMKLKLLQSDVDHHVHAAVAERGNIKAVDWNELK